MPTIKTKFSSGDIAFFVKDETISKVEINSVEFKSTSKSNEIKYFTKNKEEFSENDLLNRREIIDLIGNGY